MRAASAILVKPFRIIGADGDGSSLVQAMDRQLMADTTDRRIRRSIVTTTTERAAGPTLEPVADEAAAWLRAALDGLGR